MPRTIRFLLITLAMAVGLATTGLSAAQAADQTVTGFVRDSFGVPIDGATVAFYTDEENADAQTNVVASTATVDGDWSLTVADGDYFVRVDGPGGAYRTDPAEPFTVDDNGTYFGYSELEPKYGAFSGTVVDHEGNPYTDGCVYAYIYDANGTGDNYVWQTGASDGTYDGELRFGSYKVELRDYCSNVPATWVGGADFAGATAFTISSDEVTTVFPATKLSSGASIKGTVTDEQGNPLDHVLLTSFGADPEDSPNGPTDQVYTDAQGHYTLRGNLPGSYAIYLGDPVHEYGAGWYHDGTLPVEQYADATQVAVPGDDDVTVPAIKLKALDPDERVKTLTGKVTDVNGTPLAGIEVEADGPNYFSTITRRDGTYSFVADDIPADDSSYVLEYNDEVNDTPNGDERFLDQYYLGALSRSRATRVRPVTTPVLKTVKMVGYGTMTGTVGVPGGTGERDVEISVYDQDGDLVREDDTSRNGTFEIEQLVPGDYTVRFNGGVDGDEGYQPLIGQFYKGKYSFGAANDVVVKDLTGVSDVNVTLTDTLAAVSAPRISGTATKGKTLKATTGTWNHQTGTEYAYQWYRGSSRISGATKSSYKLGSKDVGTKVKVKVTASDARDDFKPGSSTSASTRTVKK